MPAKKLRGIRSKISQFHTDPNLPQHKNYLFVRCIPATTKNAFKTECQRQRESMRDAVIKLMRFYVYNQGIEMDSVEKKIRYRAVKRKLHNRQFAREYYHKVVKPKRLAEKAAAENI